MTKQSSNCMLFERQAGEKPVKLRLRWARRRIDVSMPCKKIGKISYFLSTLEEDWQ